MTIEQINPMAIKAKAAKLGFQKVNANGFKATLGDTMGMIGASLGPVAATTGAMYGGGNMPAYVALNAAFSGIGQTAAELSSGGGGGGMYGASMGMGGGMASSAPYLAAGTGGYKGSGVGVGGMYDPNAPAIPGTEGMSYGDMITTMNQNNLQLLELQAMMQNNMQMWNTKSNILSADHRARMAMIEKFTARG